MVAGRSLVVGRRRRADEDGEDEEGPVVVEDSQSEGSILSDMDDDDEEEEETTAGENATADAGGSAALQEPAGPVVGQGEAASKKVRKPRKRTGKKGKKDTVAGTTSTDQAQPSTAPATFKQAADTEQMMNGLGADARDGAQEVVDYATTQRDGSAPNGAADDSSLATGNNVNDSLTEKPRHESDNTRIRPRDGNPTAVPARGNFFMHDTRTHNGHAPGASRGSWNGRGRGRGAPPMAGPFQPQDPSVQNERGAEQQWKHDLHDTINEEPSLAVPATHDDGDRDREISARLFPKSTTSNASNAPLSFSSTVIVGKVSIRVFIAGMKDGKVFSDIAWKHYTRLPDHRPPLRRDKPVRVSLPDRPPRYIFPALERSFVFIPRQMRPNQQGFGRTGYQRSNGSHGFSSRRTSMYGGSAYANSIAPSRRSSFASVARETAFSPVGGYGMQSSRPVVRLPHHGSQSHFSLSSTPRGPMSGHQTPTGFGIHTFPPPQQPIHQSFTPAATVHQPRPHKNISVSGIESPMALQQQQSDNPPFQNQLPAHMHDQMQYGQQPSTFYSPHQQHSHHHQQSQDNVHSSQAHSFQPQMQYSQQAYYPPYAQSQGYYYPSGYPPMHMYSAAQNYAMPPAQQNFAAQQPHSHHQHHYSQSFQPMSEEAVNQDHTATTKLPSPQPQASSQSGMVAQEVNGMVFYMPASEAAQQQQDAGADSSYQPAESFVPAYAMPGLPPPTPAPENAAAAAAAYYYSYQQPGMYYPQSAATAMPGHGAGQ